MNLRSTHAVTVQHEADVHALCTDVPRARPLRLVVPGVHRCENPVAKDMVPGVHPTAKPGRPLIPEVLVHNAGVVPGMHRAENQVAMVPGVHPAVKTPDASKYK